MRRIAICNHKGGVGKTSLTVHLSGALAEMGLHVLLVDADSQGDLSSVFLDDPETLPYTLADFFTGSGLPARSILQPGRFPNIAILPADKRLNDLDKTTGYAESPLAEVLADALDDLADAFDVALLDCPPRPHLTGYASLVAADELLVPVQASQFSMRSLAPLHEEVQLVQQHWNPALTIRGYLMSMVPPRAKRQEEMRATLTQALGAERLLRSMVPLMEAFETAVNLRRPITLTVKNKPARNKAANVIRELAQELLGVKEVEHVGHTDTPTAAA